MNVVIAGGSGFLGSGLVASFRADGHSVTVLTRRPRGPDDVAWDPAATTGGWIGAIDGADVVINLAGEAIEAKRWTQRHKEAILHSRIEATRGIVASIERADTRPAVLVNASAVGRYGPHGSEPLTEESPPGSDFLASVCVAWETEALEASSLTRVVLIRTGLVLDRTGGALRKLALPVRFFAGGPAGSGDQYYSWIHRDDWTRMVRWAIEARQVAGPVNATAPYPVTNNEFTQALARALHRPALIPAPGFAIRLLVGEMADALVLHGQRVLPSKATHGGFEFRFPHLDAALQQLYRG